MESKPIIFRNSKARFAFLRLFAALPVACCGVMLSDPTCTPAERVASWCGIVMFGSCEAFFLWMYLDRRARIIIDSEGVFDRLLGLGRIPWTEILGARLEFMGEDAMVCLELRDPQEWIARLPARHRFLAPANQAIGFSQFNLIISNLDAAPEQVFALIKGHLRHSND